MSFQMLDRSFCSSFRKAFRRLFRSRRSSSFRCCSFALRCSSKSDPLLGTSRAARNERPQTGITGSGYSFSVVLFLVTNRDTQQTWPLDLLTSWSPPFMKRFDGRRHRTAPSLSIFGRPTILIRCCRVLRRGPSRGENGTVACRFETFGTPRLSRTPQY